MWSSIVKKNRNTEPKPNPDVKLLRNNTVRNKEIIVPDYWNDEKFEANWNPVEKQIAQSYRKHNFDVPLEVFGRPSLLDKYKN